MESESINIPLELVGSVLGTDPGVLAESLKSADGNRKPDAEIGQFFKDTFAKRLGEIRKSGLDEGYGRGKKEGLSAEEKKLAQKFEITEYQGLEGLIDAIASKASSNSKLSPEDVRKSEHYINDITSKNTEIQKLKSEFKSFKENIEAEKTNAFVNKAARAIVENPDHKYVIPQNEQIRENLFNALMSTIRKDGTRFDINETAGIVGVLDKDGAPVRDDLLKPLTFEDFVHKNAKGFFEINQGDGRQGTGNQTQPGGGAGSGAFSFKSGDEFILQYQAEKDPVKRTAMKAAYEQMVSKGLIK